MKVSVIIPALNEEDVIGKTLSSLIPNPPSLINFHPETQKLPLPQGEGRGEGGVPKQDLSVFASFKTHPHPNPPLEGEGVSGRGLINKLRPSDPEPVEVIVADGGSTDETVEIAKRYAKVVNSRPGRGVQMNAGAREATGDVLLFLHADTAPPCGWKEAILSALSDGGVVGGAFGLSIDSSRPAHKIIAFGANARSRIAGLTYGDQGIFVRSSVFHGLGGFKDMPIMEDVDLMRRLKRAGKVALLKEKVAASARRWEREGAFFTTIRNWLLVSLYYIGVAPDRLYRLYRVVR